MEKVVYIYTCEDCGSQDVELQGWINPNTGELKSFDDYDENALNSWCNDCHDHTRIDSRKSATETRLANAR
tara:strand:+ start:814 stop:1026 length:213 start_codon:yes stop_codon:yes gene_type:complete